MLRTDLDDFVWLTVEMSGRLNVLCTGHKTARLHKLIIRLMSMGHAYQGWFTFEKFIDVLAKNLWTTQT